MYIEVNDTTTIHHVQKRFEDYYPYLNINFYKVPHKKYEASKEGDLIPGNKKIGEVKKTHVSAVLEIKPDSTVAEIEKEFLHRFGLSVQVLRKQKGEWVQTRGTDDFTVKELNELARNSSDDYILSEPDSEYPDEKAMDESEAE